MTLLDNESAPDCVLGAILFNLTVLLSLMLSPLSGALVGLATVSFVGIARCSETLRTQIPLPIQLGLVVAGNLIALAAL